MHTLEPLCNLEQSELLKELGMNEPTAYFYNKRKENCFNGDMCHYNGKHNEPLISRPTISMARNWVWEKYKLWMETTYMPETQSYYARIWTELPLPFTGINDSPIIAESECLTEILKHLKNKAND